MTQKAKTIEIFTAHHENGVTWKLSVNAKRGGEFADSQAKNFARNYCRKNRIPGKVVLVSEANGREVVANVSADYTV